MSRNFLPELTIIDQEFNCELGTIDRKASGQYQQSAVPEMVSGFLAKLSKASSRPADNGTLEISEVTQTACNLVGFGPMLSALNSAKFVS